LFRKSEVACGSLHSRARAHSPHVGAGSLAAVVVAVSRWTGARRRPARHGRFYRVRSVDPTGNAAGRDAHTWRSSTRTYELFLGCLLRGRRGRAERSEEPGRASRIVHAAVAVLGLRPSDSEQVERPRFGTSGTLAGMRHGLGQVHAADPEALSF